MQELNGKHKDSCYVKAVGIENEANKKFIQIEMDYWEP